MPVQLGKVLFPLRYDVFDQAPTVRELNHLRGKALLEAGRGTPIHYHVALAEPVYQRMELAPVLSGPELEDRLERYYAARIEKLVGYYNSIQEGWDRTQDKIYFKQVDNPTQTTAGFPVPDGLFLSNGQHRVTALLALGYTELPDYIAAIEPRDGADYQPVDLTYPYIRAGKCTQRQFVEFARFRFPDIPERVKMIPGLRRWSGVPDWLLEYLDIYWGRPE